MKYVVTSYMRVGSTMVVEALAALLGVNWTYVDLQHPDGSKLSEENVKKIIEAKGVVKLHDAPAMDIVKSVPEVMAITVKRNFKDTLVSRILYERHNRYAKGEVALKSITRLLELYPNITDAALCNLYVETQEKEIKKEFFIWQRYCHTVVSSQVLVIDYDRFSQHPDKLIARLMTIVDSTEERRKNAHKCLTKDYIKSIHGNTFVSLGTIGQSRILLDRVSLDTIDKLTKKIKYAL